MHRLKVIAKFVLVIAVFGGIALLLVVFSDNPILESFSIAFFLLSAVTFSIGAFLALFALLDWILK